MRRGRGFDLRSECPFHVNVTSAMLESLYAAINNVRRSWKWLYGAASASKESKNFCKSSSTLISVPVRSYYAEHGGKDIEIMHLFDNTSLEGNTSPFLFSNHCGFKVHFCQRTSEPKLFIHYLDHGDSSSLQMPATRSIVRNLKVTKVPWSASSQQTSKVVETIHSFDMQVPGFSYIQICTDRYDRHAFCRFATEVVCCYSEFISIMTLSHFALLYERENLYFLQFLRFVV
jgi:hypothetical protein